eukprot:scaffold287_cov239-Pinguiococcus_pyrenoidosus.AAC.5
MGGVSLQRRCCCSSNMRSVTKESKRAKASASRTSSPRRRFRPPLSGAATLARRFSMLARVFSWSSLAATPKSPKSPKFTFLVRDNARHKKVVTERKREREKERTRAKIERRTHDRQPKRDQLRSRGIKRRVGLEDTTPARKYDMRCLRTGANPTTPAIESTCS